MLGDEEGDAGVFTVVGRFFSGRFTHSVTNEVLAQAVVVVDPVRKQDLIAVRALEAEHACHNRPGK